MTAVRRPVYASRRFRSPHTASPHTQFLSNGRYTAALTHAGGGYSTWRGLAITRQREDRTSDAGAHFIFLRDPWSGVRLVAHLSADVPRTGQLRRHVRSRQGDVRRAQRRFRNAPADQRVVRRRRRSPPAGDRQSQQSRRAKSRSPATRRSFWRRRRTTSRIRRSASCSWKRRSTRRAPAFSSAGARAAADEPAAWVFHVLGVEGRLGGAVEWETDRARFIGRGRSPANPLAMEGRALSGTTGAVLDPIAALRDRVRLAPGAVVRVTFATGVAADREAALALARKYRDGQHRVARVLDGVHARPHGAAAPRADRRPCDSVRPPGIAGVRRRCLLHQSGRHRAQRAGSIRPLGLRHFRRSADRAGARHRDDAIPHGAAAAAGAGVLAGQGPARGRRHSQRASGRVPRRNTERADGARAGATMGELEQPPWWNVSAARRRHARRRSSASRSRGPRRPARRSRGDGRAAGSSGAMAERRRNGAGGGRAEQSAARGDAGSGAAAGHGERHRRLHAGRSRVCRRAGRRSRDAVALVERAGEPRIRHDAQRVRLRVHLGREQPRTSIDAVRQRPGLQSHGRGHLHS